MIYIVDYGMGNLNSVQKCLKKIQSDVSISSKPEELLNASKLILPGVGHFKKAVENLKKTGIWDTLNELVLIKKIPILGICLGMQLMAKHSEEGDACGFGWFDADVIRFNVKDNLKYKIPHIGWNTTTLNKPSRLFWGLRVDPQFYFVHSYHFISNDISNILNFTEYEYKFVSGMEKENIYGVQYHPEKSFDEGEQLLKNFVTI